MQLQSTLTLLESEYIFSDFIVDYRYYFVDWGISLCLFLTTLFVRMDLNGKCDCGLSFWPQFSFQYLLPRKYIVHYFTVVVWQEKEYDYQSQRKGWYQQTKKKKKKKKKKKNPLNCNKCNRQVEIPNQSYQSAHILYYMVTI